MDCFSEYPGVEEGIERRLQFPRINWLTIDKFQQLIDDNETEIHPFISNKSNKLLDTMQTRTFVGKSIPKVPAPEQQEGTTLSYEYIELIGSVYYSGGWKLRVTHNGNAYDIEQNYLILYIKNADSFYWSSNKKMNDSNRSFVFTNSVASRFALRAAVDRIDCKYNFIGRSIEEDPEAAKRPKFYSNGWYYFDESIPQVFGKVNNSYKLMFAPLKNLEVGVDQFETLCLKASPASLKTLCRSAVRSYTNYSQQKIKSINSQERKLLPESLIHFLKYPAYLAVGEYMLKNEKLVREDDQFELAFDQRTGDLVCRAIGHQANDQLETLQSTIARNIDLIWLHRFQAVFSNQIDSIVNTIHSVNNEQPANRYRFCIEWEMANYSITNL